MFLRIFLVVFLIAFINGELNFPLNGLEITGELPSTEEKVYITSKFEDGPLSSEIQKLHPRLSFIGVINGKSFYYDDQMVSWTAAKSYCTNLGLQLGTLSNQAEADFVYGGVPSVHLWTSAILRNSYEVYEEFRYESNGASLPNFPWFLVSSAKPVMSFNAISGTDAKSLLFRHQNDLVRPLCYI